MNKKLHLSILYVILLSLLIGGAILLSKPRDKSGYSSHIENLQQNNQLNIKYENNDENIKITKSENIIISNNDYLLNLNSVLQQDNTGNTLLVFKYNKEGKQVKSIVDASSIKELENIFKLREINKSGYKITKMLLNKEQNKLYFFAEGRKTENITDTSVYSFSLSDNKIQKILYDKGEFSDFSISPDGTYNAFSYMDKKQKNNAVILRCNDGKLVLNKNNDINGKAIGNNTKNYIYSYDFVNWCSGNICKLKQKAQSLREPPSVSEQIVYYNIEKNELR